MLVYTRNTTTRETSLRGVGKVTQNGVWKCKVCDGDVDGGLSVGCDACLDWFHGRCVGIITTPKNNLDV